MFAAASASAAPNILSAAVNYSNNQIIINGTYLVYGAATPKIFFEGKSLGTIGKPTATTISAQLPGFFATGTYELKVQNGYGTSAGFEVTYGVGGPQGPQGVPGPVGPAGAHGPQGARDSRAEGRCG